MRLPWSTRVPDWSPAQIPPTPFERARREWDTRMGSAEVRARNWRLACCGSLLLSLGLLWEVMHLADAPRTIPYVVEVADSGQVRTIGSLPQPTFAPTQAMIGKVLKDWVEHVRSLSLDPVVVRAGWWKAYAFVTPKAASQLTAYVKEVNPLSQVGQLAVTVEVRSVLPLSERTYQVQWLETVYDLTGREQQKTQYTGMFHTLVAAPPTNEKARQENPLGLYIAAFSWTKDAV